MRAFFAVAASAIILAGCVEEPRPGGPPSGYTMGTNFVVPETLTFDEGREVLHTPNGAEPGAEVAPDGTLYVVAWTNVHRSDDGGETWQALATPFTHNGDSDLAVTPDGVLHFVGMPLKDQEGPRLPYYRSTDKGESWSQPIELGIVGQSIDRPWMVEDARGCLALTWNHFDADENLARVSCDFGATWTDPVVVANPRYKVPGPAVWRGQDIIQPLNNFQSIDLAVSTDLGQSWEIVPGVKGKFSLFPTLAVDRQGHLHLAATALGEGGRREIHVFDAPHWRGAWSEPRNISGGTEGVMPWIIGGQGNAWAVAFYAAEQIEPEQDPIQRLISPAAGSTRWHVDVAMENPYERGTIQRVRASDNVREGAICSNGAGCDAAAWQFKDYFEMEVTPFGNLFVVHMTGPAPAGDFPVRAVISKYG